MTDKELLQHMATFLGDGFIIPGQEFRYSTGFVGNDYSSCPMCGQPEVKRHKPDCKMVMFIEYLKRNAEDADENRSSH